MQAARAMQRLFRHTCMTIKASWCKLCTTRANLSTQLCMQCACAAPPPRQRVARVDGLHQPVHEAHPQPAVRLHEAHIICQGLTRLHCDCGSGDCSM